MAEKALTAGAIQLPKTVAAAITTKVKDSSTIAALSPQLPQLFADNVALVFDGASEAEVVAEGAAKSSYNQEVTAQTAKRVKIQTTTRVTSELQWADEDNRTEIIDRIQEDQAAALGRALDYVVYHAVNPKTGAVLPDFTKLSDTATQVTAGTDETANMDNLISAVNEDYEVNGLALSKTWANNLRKLRVPSTGMRLYPEIPLNLQTTTVEGLTAATSSTVSGRRATEATKVLAFIGDFNMIRWGMIRDITAELIPYGDPDQSGVDLKAHNQIAYRTEAVLAYSVLDPHAFAVLKKAA